MSNNKKSIILVLSTVPFGVVVLVVGYFFFTDTDMVYYNLSERNKLSNQKELIKEAKDIKKDVEFIPVDGKSIFEITEEKQKQNQKSLEETRKNFAEIEGLDKN